MSKISEMTRDSWIKSTFPEWGTWLVEDIENAVVPEGNVAMWWLGCTGIWFKTPGGANITIDLWCGNGKRTHGDGKMKVGHQMANMCGGRLMQPNLRNVPFVIDPFAFKPVFPEVIVAPDLRRGKFPQRYFGFMLIDLAVNGQTPSQKLSAAFQLDPIIGKSLDQPLREPEIPSWG